jgi:hypothetical protein
MTNLVSAYTNTFTDLKRVAKGRIMQATCRLAIQISTSERHCAHFNKGVSEYLAPEAKRLNASVQLRFRELHTQAAEIIAHMSVEGTKTKSGRLYAMVTRFFKLTEDGWRRDPISFDVMSRDICDMQEQGSREPRGENQKILSEFHTLLSSYKSTVMETKLDIESLKSRHLKKAKKYLQPLFNKLKWLYSKAKSFMAYRKEVEKRPRPGFLDDLPEVPRSIRKAGFEWAAHTSTTEVKYFLACRALEKHDREKRPPMMPDTWYESAAEIDIINYGEKWAEFGMERKKLREQYTCEIALDMRRDFDIVKRAVLKGVCYISRTQTNKYAYRVVNELRESLWKSEFPSERINTREDYELAAARRYEHHVVCHDAEAAARENRPRQTFTIVDRVLAMHERRWSDKKRLRDRQQQIADASVYPKGVKPIGARAGTRAHSPQHERKSRKRKRNDVRNPTGTLSQQRRKNDLRAYFGVNRVGVQQRLGSAPGFNRLASLRKN